MSADNVTFHKVAFRTVSICICGSDSVVECHLAKVEIASSNLVFRSNLCTFSSVGRAPDS